MPGQRISGSLTIYFIVPWRMAMCGFCFIISSMSSFVLVLKLRTLTAMILMLSSCIRIASRFPYPPFPWYESPFSVVVVCVWFPQRLPVQTSVHSGVRFSHSGYFCRLVVVVDVLGEHRYRLLLMLASAQGLFFLFLLCVLLLLHNERFFEWYECVCFICFFFFGHP